jgi:bacteriorhodopsin
MGNGALQENGFTNTVTVNNHITVRGSDWYWTVCSVMIVATGIFMGLAFTKPR